SIWPHIDPEASSTRIVPGRSCAFAARLVAPSARAVPKPAAIRHKATGAVRATLLDAQPALESHMPFSYRKTALGEARQENWLCLCCRSEVTEKKRHFLTRRGFRARSGQD